MIKVYVIYIKRKLRTCRIRIQIEKVWFIAKNWKKKFSKFFFKGGTLWCRNNQKNFVHFFNFSKLSLENGFNGKWKMLKKQSHEILVHLEHPLGNYKRSGSVNQPPCRIGLNCKFRIFQLNIYLILTSIFVHEEPQNESTNMTLVSNEILSFYLMILTKNPLFIKKIIYLWTKK